MHDWKEIRQRHGSLVFGVASRILKHHDQALDCVQEVFLEAFQHCPQHPVENWSALLRWISVRRALDRLRKQRRFADRFDTDHDAALLPAVERHPSDELEFQELIDRVRREVTRLPDRQGEAFWLRCVEQRSSAEVAEQLGTDANAIGVLVHRARMRLRELLADVNPLHVGKYDECCRSITSNEWRKSRKFISIRTAKKGLRLRKIEMTSWIWKRFAPYRPMERKSLVQPFLTERKKSF